MMMIIQQVNYTRSEMVEFLQRQINKIPSWETCLQMEPNQLREIAKYELDFDIFRTWMQNPKNEINLSKDEIGEKWFQFFLYFILDAETNECFYGNFDLFDMKAREKVGEMLKNTRRYSLVSIKLEDFLEFAKDPFQQGR